MKAAVFHAVNTPLTIEEVDMDKPMAREVVVRTAASGVCHSDLHYVEGLYPTVTPSIVGMIPAGQKIEIEGRMFLGERKIQGSGMGSNRFRVDMPRLIEFYRQGRLRLDEMITRRGRLEDVNEAFRAMKAGEVTRTVLMFD